MHRLVIILLILSGFSIAAVPDTDWRYVGNSQDFTRFSGLTQIRKENVSELKAAWIYHTGGNSDALHTTIECTPIVIKGIMYVTSPVLEVIALDAATGREIWKYNPFPDDVGLSSVWYGRALWPACGAGMALFLVVLWRWLRRRARIAVALGLHCPAVLAMIALGAVAVPRLIPNPMDEERRGGPNRGLSYWEQGSEKRLFFAGGHRLVALDPENGAPVAGFGDNGVVDLRKGLSRDIGGLSYAVTSPGTIYKDVIMLSARVGEGPRPAAPGDIRAYDVRTGKLRWTFHTIPHPGERGYNTWPPDAWKRVGGANAWGGMTVDEARGMVYAPIGSATFDFYGGDRAGKNLFSDSLVALRAETGELVWYYQMVHHDLWDYDLPTPPNLVTLQRGGKSVDAVVEPLKNGFIFVLNRDTGEPLFPVEERPVPASDLPGEQAWPTQPVPLKPPPYSRLEIGEDDLTQLTPEAHAFALAKFRQATSARIFVPPNKHGRIVTPGFHGGSNWSGASFDPLHQRLVLNVNEFPFFLQMTEAHWWQPFPYTHKGFIPFLDEEGFPAIKPPWGKLVSIDLDSGDFAWQVPLGEFSQLTARGIPPTGTQNAGGSILTAGGLIFMGATQDRMFRAFDADTGRVLWQTTLDAAGHAAPCTYAIGGKQYVAIAAGGGSMVGSPSGDEYVAFALP